VVIFGRSRKNFLKARQLQMIDIVKLITTVPLPSYPKGKRSHCSLPWLRLPYPMVAVMLFNAFKGLFKTFQAMQNISNSYRTSPLGRPIATLC
jgi:hypothetical protein